MIVFEDKNSSMGGVVVGNPVASLVVATESGMVGAKLVPMRQFGEIQLQLPGA